MGCIYVYTHLAKLLTTFSFENAAIGDILDKYQGLIFDFWVRDLMVKKDFERMSRQFKTEIDQVGYACNAELSVITAAR